jgi:hypothetical protein
MKGTMTVTAMIKRCSPTLFLQAEENNFVYAQICGSDFIRSRDWATAGLRVFCYQPAAAFMICPIQEEPELDGTLFSQLGASTPRV